VKYGDLIYWSVGIIALIIILIAAIRFFRHRFEPAEDSSGNQNIHYRNTEADVKSGKSLLSHRFKTPSNSIRKLIYQFERHAEKADAGRYSYETLDAWKERIGFHVDLTAYKKVRYGDVKKVSDEEAKALKKQLQVIRNNLKKRKSQE